MSIEAKGSMGENPKMERRDFRGFDLVKLVPEHPTSSLPVLIVPGYRCGADSYELLMRCLASSGLTPVCIDYQPEAEDQPKKWGMFPDVNKVKQEAMQVAIDTEGFPNEQGIKQVQVIGHSKGALDTILFAKDHPKNFVNCVLAAPRGIMMPTNTLAAMNALRIGDRRNKRDKVRFTEEHPELSQQLADIRRIERRFEADGTRYLMEIVTTATQTIHNHFQYLKENGVQIVIVAQSNDGYYPVEDLSSILTSGSFPVDGFIVASGIHGALKYDSGLCLAVANLLKRMKKNHVNLVL